MGLQVSCGAMNIWYFCRTLTEHIEMLDKDWIVEAKSNRVVWFHGKWVSLQNFAEKMFRKYNFKVEYGDKPKITLVDNFLNLFPKN